MSHTAETETEFHTFVTETEYIAAESDFSVAGDWNRIQYISNGTEKITFDLISVGVRLKCDF